MRLILSFLICSIALSLSAATTIEVDVLYYNLLPDSVSAEVTYPPGNYMSHNPYNPYNPYKMTTLSIPSSVSYNGKTYTVTTIGDHAFFGSSLVTVTIPNTVTKIEWYAFGQSSNLITINIPNSVYDIEREAFYSTKWYDNQPDGVIYAGLVALRYKGEMPPGTILNLRSDCTGIAAYFYYNVFGDSCLIAVNMGNNVKVIGDYAFCGSSNLSSISLSNKLESINMGALSRTGIVNISLPASLKTLGESAFSGCTALKTATLGSNITTLNNSTFYGCTSLTSITIPAGVTYIGQSCFSQSGLTSITIPDATKSIDWRAFANCEALKTVSFPQSLQLISSLCFTGCTALTSVTLPNWLTYLGDKAFSGCSALKNVTIGTSLKTIEAGTFLDCINLQTINFNSATSLIRADAFKNTEWYNAQPDGLVYAGNVAYDYKGTMPQNTTVTLNSNCLGVAEKAFYNQSNLEAIIMPDSLEQIGATAFYGCSSLLEMTIPDKVPQIYNQTFYGCSAMQKVLIGKGLDAFLGDNSFSGCSSLTEVRVAAINPIPYHNGTIHGNTFSGVDKNVCILYVPRGHKSIYQNAFMWKDFKNIEEWEPDWWPIAGDVDGDCMVTSADVTSLYNWLLNGDDTNIVNGDVDGDGVITSADVTTVYNQILGQ